MYPGEGEVCTVERGQPGAFWVRVPLEVGLQRRAVEVDARKLETVGYKDVEELQDRKL